MVISSFCLSLTDMILWFSRLLPFASLGYVVKLFFLRFVRASALDNSASVVLISAEAYYYLLGEFNTSIPYLAGPECHS